MDFFVNTILKAATLAEAHHNMEEYIDSWLESNVIAGWTRTDYENAVRLFLFEMPDLCDKLIELETTEATFH